MGQDDSAQAVQTAENGPAVQMPAASSGFSSLFTNKWVIIAAAALAVGWYKGYINPKKFGF